MGFWGGFEDPKRDASGPKRDRKGFGGGDPQGDVVGTGDMSGPIRDRGTLVGTDVTQETPPHGTEMGFRGLQKGHRDPKITLGDPGGDMGTPRPPPPALSPTPETRQGTWQWLCIPGLFLARGRLFNMKKKKKLKKGKKKIKWDGFGGKRDTEGTGEPSARDTAGTGPPWKPPAAGEVVLGKEGGKLVARGGGAAII